MYNNKLAVAIKVNGKVLREYKDTVYIPFGSEYSIYIKNLNSKRAIVKLSIDNNDMLSEGLVVNAGEEITLERSIKGGNLTEGNRFKFIERTGDIEQHRGIGAEDGLIVLSYQFEQVKVYAGPIWTSNNSYDNYYHGTLRGISISGSMSKGVTGIATASCNAISTNSIAGSAACMDATLSAFNDAGITVPGSVSTQKFSTVQSFDLEPEKHVMVLKLLGQTPNNVPVLTPVTVAAKAKCTTCGHNNKATAKFCNKCGTSLVVYA